MMDRFRFRSPALGLDVLVLEVWAEERTQSLYRARAQLCMPARAHGSVSSWMLGQRGVLTLDPSDGAPRHLHGLVARVDATGRTHASEPIYEIDLRPAAHRLTLRRTYRVFQDLSVPDIVRAVLGEHGIVPRLRFSREYSPKSYVVQYDESDWGFVTRLLSREGIALWFDHPIASGNPDETNLGSNEVLVLSDSPSSYSPIVGGDALSFRPALHGGLVHGSHDVLAFHLRERTNERIVASRSFDVERPEAAMVDAAGMPQPVQDDRALLARALKSQAVYAFDGSREAQRSSTTPANVLLEQERARVTIGAGESHCAQLMPGRTFHLSGHPNEGVDGSFAVTRVVHRGRATGMGDANTTYSNTFEVVPAATLARPKSRRRRHVRGTETATVVGPQGETVFADELGRIKVQFHWDLEGSFTDRSSCWVRVSNAWAGAGWGTQFIPRIGMQVLVGFIQGDPDRPVVMGCLHDGLRPPAFGAASATASGIQTRSVPEGEGGHALIFEDAANAQSVALRSSGVLALASLHDANLTVGADYSVEAAGGRKDRYGASHVSVVASDRSATIGGSQATTVGGSKAVRVAGDIHTTVGGEVRRQVSASSVDLVGGGRLTMIGGSATLPVDDSLSVRGSIRSAASRSVLITAGELLELRCGDTRLRLLPDSVEIVANTIRFQGHDRLELAQGSPNVASSVVLTGSVGISGGEVIAKAAAGGTLHLDADAKLDGALVKLNCGPGEPLGAKPVLSEQSSGVATLRLDPGAAAAVVVRVQMPDGETRSFQLSPGAAIPLEGAPGDRFAIVDVRYQDTPIAFSAKRDTEGE